MHIIIVLLIIIIILLCPSLLGIPLYAITAIISLITDLIVPISIYSVVMLILYVVGKITCGKLRLVRVILSLPLSICIAGMINFSGMYLLSYILLFSSLFLIANQELMFIDDEDVLTNQYSEDIIVNIFISISLFFIALIFMYELQFSLDDTIYRIERTGTLTDLLTMIIFPFILLIGIVSSFFLKKWYLPIFIIIGLFAGNDLHKLYPKIEQYILERQMFDHNHSSGSTIEYRKEKEPYQGSRQQKEDLDKIDQYMKDHPDF